MKDSIGFFLEKANSDSLSIEKRIAYNVRAYSLIQTQANDSLSRVQLFKVANRYYNANKLNNYKEISYELYKKASIAKDTFSLAKASLYLGDFYKNTTIVDSAFSYYRKAETLYKSLNDIENLASVNLKEAAVLFEETDYFGAESAALRSLNYLKNSKDKQKLYEALTMLGLVSNALNNYPEALDYLEKALKVAEENDLTIDNPMETTFNNIGNVYQNAGNNKKAIVQFEEALSHIKIKNSNPILYSILLDNLAYSKFKSGISDQNISQLFFKSIKVKDSLNYLSGIVFSKTRLAEYYNATGKKDSALQLSTEALAVAKKTGNVGDELYPLKLLSTYDVHGNKYSESYIRINDSIQRAERNVKDRFARIQYKTQEITEQKDALADQNRTLLLFFIGTVMIGLLLFVIRTQRAKNRELLLTQAQQKANEDIYNLMLSQQNKIEEGRVKEKKRIAQELHDGVLSRLFGARLNLDHLNKLDGGEAVEKRNNYLSELKNIEQDIREISHDLNREKFVLVNNFLAILNNLLEEQAANFNMEVEKFVDENIQWDTISNTLKINIYRIVQEALQNINKYAKATVVKIALDQDNNSNLRLEVSDNGQGFAVDKKSRGIGLQNMVSRTAECNGVFDITSQKGKGTTISISFPTIENTKENPITTLEPIISAT
jgi:signal transduction histidine kinase